MMDHEGEDSRMERCRREGTQFQEYQADRRSGNYYQLKEIINLFF